MTKEATTSLFPLGFVEHKANKDLERFKEFIESRGQETGAWRGEVDQDHGGSSRGGPQAR